MAQTSPEGAVPRGKREATQNVKLLRGRLLQGDRSWGGPGTLFHNNFAGPCTNGPSSWSNYQSSRCVLAGGQRASERSWLPTLRERCMITHHTRLGNVPSHASRLVVAPHAGDEVLGCGGMIAKHCDDAMVVILAGVDEIRTAQLATALHMLGGPEVVFFGLSERRLADDLDLLVTELSDLVAKVRPAEIYLPYPLLHEDHLIAFEAGMRSTQTPVRGDGLAQVSVLAYHLGAAAPGDYPADIQWNVCEPLAEEDVDRKVAAAIAYREPAAANLKPRAEDVGSSRDVPWAEQFAVVRCARGVEPRHVERGTRVPDLAGVPR